MSNETIISLGIVLFYLLVLVIIVVLYVGAFRMLEKAGKPGLAIFVPVYEQLVLLDIVEKPRKWIALWLLLIITTTLPFNIFIGIELAKRFNRGQAFGIIVCGFMPLLGFAMIGFDESSTYKPLDETSTHNIPSKSPLNA